MKAIGKWQHLFGKSWINRDESGYMAWINPIKKNLFWLYKKNAWENIRCMMINIF